jgi:predicted SAM-dependent methyltransferase
MRIMSKPELLNLGCGSKYHKDWTNVDFVSNDPNVVNHNLLKGIPFPENSFDVVYHSQVLEHFEKDDAVKFIKECFRVLKPGGIIRVVVPDLENIASEYLRLVKANIDNPTERNKADYDWIMLEFYDQTVRNKSGGKMAEFLKDPGMINKEYVEGRIGYSDKSERKGSLSNNSATRKSIIFRIRQKILRFLINTFSSEQKKIGELRMSGEIHYWMYDRFSLSQILKETGLADIKVKDAYSSCIPDWGKYELDVKNGKPFDPTSLFVEAIK